MEYKKLISGNDRAIADHLGVDRLELCGGELRKRVCPNCTTYDHPGGVTSAQCQEWCWRCPGCTHGTACGEYRDGTFKKRFVRRDGSLRRFIDARDFAARLGIHVNTVYRWVNKGKLNDRNGLLPGTSPYQPIIIDSEKCALLKSRRRRLVSAAA